VDGVTIASASSRDVSATGEKISVANEVGKAVAEKAKAAGVDTVSFDRGGYLYHGRVLSLANGAREAGLKF
ncbi:50S ribosomal protein L18, partial [Nonlabens mediterrranea]|nr:50S ribosomal protein L18 [Nonlabens mediterrranea]